MMASSETSALLLAPVVCACRSSMARVPREERTARQQPEISDPSDLQRTRLIELERPASGALD